MSIDFIYGKLERAGGEPIVVEATISLLATELGGRSSPIANGYRPNHNFEGPESRNMVIGQLELQENDTLAPGESRDLLVTFLNAPGLAEKLSIGMQWRLQEGARLVGTGKVKRVAIGDSHE